MVSQEAVHPHGYVKSGHDGHAGGTIQSYSASLALKSAEGVLFSQGDLARARELRTVICKHGLCCAA